MATTMVFWMTQYRGISRWSAFAPANPPTDFIESSSRQFLVGLPYSHDGLRQEQSEFRAAVGFRRGVTLRGVHPNFARAVADRSVRGSVDRL